MVVLFHDWDTAATCSDNDLIRIEKCIYSVQFHDLYRVWRGYHTAEAFSGFFDDIVSFLALFICLLRIHVTAKYLSRCVKCLIIRIDDNLREYCADCAVNPPV